MSFFAKIKQFAGIGTLDVKLQAPGQFAATDTQLDGTLHITAKSDQSILKISVELREEFTTGRDDDKKEKRFVLGSVRLTEPFRLKQGESRAVPFSLGFELRKSANAQLQDKGGMLGGLGKLNAWAAGEKSSYELFAEVDVEGTPLDPSDKLDLKLVK